MARREPATWRALMSRLATLVGDYALAQIAAGVDAVQLFDSWAGALSPADYAEYVLPYVQQVVAGVRGRGLGVGDRVAAKINDSPAPGPQPLTPVIYFATGTSGMLALLRQTGADVIGVDWRTPLDVASSRVGPDYAVQGNLDPTVLLAPWPVIETEVRRVLAEGARTPGHIFNLGHGVLPETDPEVLTRVVALVHSA